MDKQQVHMQIKRRLLDIFSTYQRGDDVPPAQLFRTEGFVEACCVLMVVTVDEAFEMLSATYFEVFNQKLPFSHEQGFKIPTAMKRAPVYPST